MHQQRLTEADAKTKVCRIAGQKPDATCVAGQCMHWLWEGEPEKPYSTAEFVKELRAQELKGLDRALAQAAALKKFKDRAQSTRKGCCGLVNHIPHKEA